MLWKGRRAEGLWERLALSNGGNMRCVIACLTIAAISLVVGGGIVRADFTLGEATNLGPIVNSSSWDVSPCLSPDGLSLYFQSDRPGGSGSHDIWVTTRETLGDPWTEPVNLGSTVNSPDWDISPSVTGNGELYFGSTRPGGHGALDIWMTTRSSAAEAWDAPVNLGPMVNSPSGDAGEISADGLSMVINSNRPGGYGGQDLWISTRPTLLDAWSEPVNLGATINSPDWDWEGVLAADNRVLLFTSQVSVWGGDDIWYCTRTTVDDPWGAPVNFGPTVNSSSHDDFPCVSFDGSMLYFNSNRPGGSGSPDLYQAPILPVVDLNDDGTVDVVDIDIMIEYWGTDDPLCDIGPMPWGDGVVDVQDLLVLVEHIVEARADVDAADEVE